MSEWGFLCDLEGDELMEAMYTGMTDADYEYLKAQEREKRRKARISLKKLRDPIEDVPLDVLERISYWELGEK